ncbi:adenylosuccinate lyase, partial [Cloacibacillus evryensis]|uniref:adenylosuccinate lyase n=1 Tax=Cloacibacillus evryensis TaxID=508460 RepID=UPI00241D8D85
MIPRYETQEIKKIWTDENRFGRWLDVELAATRAWNEAGIVPDEDFRNIKEKAGFNVARIREIEEVTQHDVIAFVSSVAETIGESGRFVHLGLTSSDVIDTASSLLLGESMDVVIGELKKLHGILGEKAVEYKLTPCPGRTHGIHAEPTSFGLKMAGFYAEFARHLKRVEAGLESVRVGKISGAVGTYAFLSPELEQKALSRLGLKVDPHSTQIIQRDRYAHFFTSLAIMAGGVERLCVELRHLQRTEVLEVEEGFAKGQKGSSAMPHKRNPITAERVCGLARIVKANAQVGLDDVALWFERDISHSGAERVGLADSFTVVDYMFGKMQWMLDGLQTYPAKMEHNLWRTKGLIFSSKVLLALVDAGISREDAYVIVQRNAMK